MLPANGDSLINTYHSTIYLYIASNLSFTDACAQPRPQQQRLATSQCFESVEPNLILKVSGNDISIKCTLCGYETRMSVDVKTDIEYITSNFILHKFNTVINERKIIYQAIKMKDSLLIIINDKENMRLSSIFMALLNKYDNLPVGTSLLGGFNEEDSSRSIACRLSKKLDKTVYVSCNLGETRHIVPLVEKRIYEEIQENPECF